MEAGALFHLHDNTAPRLTTQTPKLNKPSVPTPSSSAHWLGDVGQLSSSLPHIPHLKNHDNNGNCFTRRSMYAWSLIFKLFNFISPWVFPIKKSCVKIFTSCEDELKTNYKLHEEEKLPSHVWLHLKQIISDSNRMMCIKAYLKNKKISEKMSPQNTFVLIKKLLKWTLKEAFKGKFLKDLKQ